jgi:2-hydroxy-6-oxonona-2,4-dienedioate hydrolase
MRKVCSLSLKVTIYCRMQSRTIAPLEKLRSKWVCLDSVKTHALVPAAPAPADSLPLIILPGFVVSSRYVESAAEWLASFYQVYVPDLPGSGRSDRPKVLPDLAGLARFLDIWMQEIGLDRATILGASFGSQIATEFAVRYPDRVARIVMVGPTMDPEARTPLIWRWLINASREPPLSKGMLKDYLDVSPRWVFHLAKQALQDRIEDKLPSIHTPTLVVQGSQDALSPPEWTEQVVSLLPNARLETIPEASHSILSYWIKEFADRATPFLKEGFSHMT